MRILDRYATRQLIPVWLWCLVVFVFVSVLIDLFGHLEEILRYRLPLHTVLHYYANFTPLVVVKASPLALLLSTSFVAMQLVRHYELLAMQASGQSRRQASIPFAFVGWVVTVLMFVINEQVVPSSSAVYERLRHEAFRGEKEKAFLENVAVLDESNRLYHARQFDATQNELRDLMILEHDSQTQPTRSIYARRALLTPAGWLLLYGTINQLGPRGALVGEPQPFVERLLNVPLKPEALRQQETQPETMRAAHLSRLIRRLRDTGVTNVRRYQVELASKFTLPLMNLVICLIGFVGSTKTQHARGHLRGLGTSLGWGIAYYIAVAVGQGIGKEGFLPVAVAVWAPHLIVLGLCWRALK